MTSKSKLKKESFLEWNNKVLMSSLKRMDFGVFFTVIVDLAFYILSALLVFFWLQRIQSMMDAINLPGDVLALGQQRAQQLIAEVRQFYYIIIISFILVVLAIIFLASILKSIVWAKSTQTKLSFKLVSRFLALNLIWMGFWFAIVFFISYMVQQQSAPAFMAAALTLSLYFTGILYTLFMKEAKLSQIFSAIRLGSAKIHLFFLPFAAVISIVYIILKLFSLLDFIYSQVFSAILVVIFLAFARYYISDLVMAARQK